VPFTLVHAGKDMTEDKSKTDRHYKTKHNPEKANNTKHSKTKLAWISFFLRHFARKRDRLILQCSRAQMLLNHVSLIRQTFGIWFSTFACY